MKNKLTLSAIALVIIYFIGPNIIHSIYKCSVTAEKESNFREKYQKVTESRLSNDKFQEYLYYWFRVRGWEIDQGDENVYTSDEWAEIFHFWSMEKPSEMSNELKIFN